MPVYLINGLLVAILLLAGKPVICQKAEVREADLDISTYPFSDPNPITTLITRPGIYPYHRYDGYSHKPVMKKWKVVTLENDYIRVDILPEIGGKIWGAIEKSTGKDFIYKNDVIKFRNIAMRGPWTSGGIEFNFGLIGHTPSTATPVDFITTTDDVGNVACTVGMMDLPSRTQWRVKIVLPKDKAYFTTEATWYNPTALRHPYYNWMTAAAKTSSDLVFYFPGDVSLQHSGETTEWPKGKDGRKLSHYRENNFGSSKSYHVVGRYHNFFGGYWDNEDFGFGHAGQYETMPGQKLWLWSLARDGGIWEDLLTDDNGQYMEFQAGRLFNQYFNDDIDNPITEVAFAPHLTDQWEERWFPVKGTGGLTSVGDCSVSHIKQQPGMTSFSLNALCQIEDTLRIRVDNSMILEKFVELKPMDVGEFSWKNSGELAITLGKEVLYDEKIEEQKSLKRPFKRQGKVSYTEAQEHCIRGLELFKKRKFRDAKSRLYHCLKLEPANFDAHNLLAEIHYRNALYDSALYHVGQTLQHDTYDFDANYMAGVTYKALGDTYNALDALGMAGRSMKYRSAAFTEMAGLRLFSGDSAGALSDGQYALQFNTQNVRALQMVCLASRQLGDILQAQSYLNALLVIDPLNHFAHFETYLVSGDEADLKRFKLKITNEFAYQIYLEIASIYLQTNRIDDALLVLAESPSHPIIDLWTAFCLYKQGKPFLEKLNKILESPAAYVFPYRTETLDMLQWANKEQTSWKLRYYLGLNYWAKDRLVEATDQMISAGDPPGAPYFYVSRAHLLEDVYGHDPLLDLRKAVQQEHNQWRYHHALTTHFNQKKKHSEQLDHSTSAYTLFPDHHVIVLDHAQALVNNERFDEALDLLSNVRVLPSEGSFSGRQIYGEASIRSALSYFKQGKYTTAKERLALSYLYPENLGSGRPFDPDERLVNLLMAQIEHKLGNDDRSLYQKVAGTQHPSLKESILNLYALDTLGDKQGVDRLIHKLTENEHPDARWVVNRWKNKLPVIEILDLLISE